MKITCLLPILLLVIISTNAQEEILFFQTDWGNTLSWDAFCKRAKSDGYDGIEIWLPTDPQSRVELKTALRTYGLKVGFLNGTNRAIPFEESLKAYITHFDTLIAWQPAYINCHTGSDFYTIAQNSAFIKAANKKAVESGIPIYHETHRGRFSFNLPATNRYLREFPDLKLTLDISHWMVVHESLLKEQDKALEAVIKNSHHIHARVGHAEGPQVNDPEAPEWQDALDRHLEIWELVIGSRSEERKDAFTITTEFGPPNYLPTLPYTQMPLADQWQANVYIMNAIKARLYGE